MRFILASRSGAKPTLETMLPTDGSSFSSRFSEAISRSSRSAALAVMASRICCSGARRAISRWIRVRCSKRRWRSCSESTRRSFSSAWAFRLDDVQGLQAQLEDPGHAAQQADVLVGEAGAGAAQHQHAGGLAADASRG